MATPPTLIHDSTRPRDVLVALSLLGLAMLHLWELPHQAAGHGGFAFIGAWLLGLLLLTLPLLLLELMLGRRSRRSPLEGLAFLTREADARRGWRASSWGAALAALLALAAMGLLAGAGIGFLARDLGLVDAAASTGLALPLGTGGLFILAAGLSLLAPQPRGYLNLGLLVLALLLLAAAAVSGLGLAEVVYAPRALTAEDWRAAFRLALLSLGGGLGVVWLGGMGLPRETSLGRLALGLLPVLALLAVLLLLAVAPFEGARQLNSQTGLQVSPSGSAAWLLLGALILVALLTLALLAEPVLTRLKEKGLGRLPAVVAVFFAGALLAEAVWFLGRSEGLQTLRLVLGVLLLLVLFGLTVFGGWVMKISHARKELVLPNEAIYNVWRVAVRIVVPLAILWALTSYFA